MGIYKRGKVYWVRWVEDGERHRKSLGTKSRREAEILFEQLTGKSSPRDISPRDTSPPRILLREVLKLWLKHQTSRCKPKSIRIYETACKRFTMSFGDRRPEEITTLLVEQFQDKLLMVGLSPRTINHQIGIALSAIKWAHDRELIDTAPPKWKPLKIRVKHSRKYLTTSELKKLMEKMCLPRWKRLEPVIMLALYAGLRQQEIVWLTWEDVDLEDGWLHIRSKRNWSPKSSSSERSIPIAIELALYLNDKPRVCSRWVAPQSPGNQWCRQHLGAKTRRLFKEAGVDDGGPHTLHRLRGTCATNILRGGGDLQSLKEILGHQNLTTTAGYLEATSESKRRAMGGLSFSS